MAPKHDTSAVVWVYVADGRVTLAHCRIWTPRGEALDLEETVEAHLREMYRLHRVDQILFDPYQFHRSAMTLQRDGLPIVEFPQTAANTTRMGQVLFDLLRGRNLRLYADAELRQQALNTVAVESPRGFRIAKEKASRKIDAIVALSMACVAAIDGGGNDGRLYFQQAPGMLFIQQGRPFQAGAPEPEPAEIAARAAKAEADELEKQRLLEEREQREIWSRSEAWTNMGGG